MHRYYVALPKLPDWLNVEADPEFPLDKLVGEFASFKTGLFSAAWNGFFLKDADLGFNMWTGFLTVGVLTLELESKITPMYMQEDTTEKKLLVTADNVWLWVNTHQL